VSLLQLTSEEVDTLGALTYSTASPDAGSVDISAMLRDLKTTFTKNKYELDTEEANNKFTFNKVQANMTKLLKFAKEDKTEKTSEKVEKEGKKA
jgi:deoxycytidylate deaminase